MIKLDEELLTYMKEKGYQDLVLYLKSGGGCCVSSYLDVKARFAKDGDQELLYMGYVTQETEVGKIYYHPEQITFGNQPKLILSQFMGMTAVQAFGMRASENQPLKGVPF